MPRITFLPMNRTVEVDAGTTVLEAAHEHDIALEGACEGSLACSTCHVIVAREWYPRLEAADDEEEDMLDRAFGVTPTSRLGCQLQITDDLDGITVTIPEYSVNIHVDKKRGGA
ncbi:MAG: 2Fe-2S iron-sulfur cluster binding domain-containing protein [Magnetococcales bacterium]|nr:2Fe-2S iron-sulfur cluster binding domain-containing protein [Magnetococcales bacterium]MBF0151586.1 2Fe-2S iron-sulfur cluster binding domain-containing protein [Magnetococcales bacterium]MBF0173989.1 2Fe-2S iron-sulfur cluster binding domain-containing protein [Magnetococcales bacterium]MBF0348734.1 2Fe-2S iron-sulfur cluster binding domain-containing protein [Magnetococcales bacterium]MBF0630716.1 2Fe-2S iron-sulfur cluster binding domain-containing protein [Magnetococcales bacterium]